MTAVEVVLSYESGVWRARGAGVDVVHENLCEIDARVLRAAMHEPDVDRVHMRFDLAMLPVWIRQYHAHYCNYVLCTPATQTSP